MCLCNFFAVDVFATLKKKYVGVERRNTKEDQVQKQNKDQCMFKFLS